MSGFEFNHIGVVTNKPDDAINFYKNFMGFAVEKDFNVPGMRMVLLDGAGCKVELLCPEKEAQKVGPRHIAFTVCDIDRLFEEAVAAGFMVYPPGIQTHENLRFFFLKAPGGEDIELMEVKDA
ncbi:MAG: VOC family protein [Chloroflexi bacterium]|nr:VOC family protein [Chloroflexota bacterium]